MMYLTRMHLNPARRGTRHLLASRQRLHAAVMASVPASESPEGRMLWRLDEKSPALTLFIASPAHPDLTHLVEQAGWPTTQAWDTREYAPFLGRLALGQQWHFRLTANPVRQVSRDGKRSQFQAARTPQHAQEWLEKRQETFGFRLLPNGVPGPSDGERMGVDLVVSGLKMARFDKRDEDGGGRGRTHQISVAMVTYEGTLEVSDAPALRSALRGGMGRARGYGCGLMTLAAP